MTYRLDPWVCKIESLITLIFPDGEKRTYSSGKEATEDVFTNRYLIKTIRAVDNSIEIDLMVGIMPDGNESFF